jgi:hypothetical protein
MCHDRKWESRLKSGREDVQTKMPPSSMLYDHGAICFEYVHSGAARRQTPCVSIDLTAASAGRNVTPVFSNSFRETELNHESRLQQFDCNDPVRETDFK